MVKQANLEGFFKGRSKDASVECCDTASNMSDFPYEVGWFQF